MATLTGLSKKLEILSTNPSAAQRLILRSIRAVNGNDNFIVDASNPAVLLLEANIASACAIMNQNDALFRKVFSSLATSPSDLYYHMSDNDYLDRFAKAGSNEFIFYIHYDEVLVKAVPLNDGSGVKVLTIPKHTSILVGGVYFTMQYAINIRVLPQGGISVLYDVSSTSPIETLSTNNVKWSFVTLSGYKFIAITTTVKQMQISSQVAQLNAITGFSANYAFSDQFYYARAYTKDENDNAWVEIRTTHSDMVYDISVPTVSLKLLDGLLGVTVPQVYFNNGLIKNTLRIDIYTTKGEVNLNFSNYDTRAFQVTWNDPDTELTSVYSAPFNTFSGFMVFAPGAVTSGSNALSFTELRDRVIDDSGRKELPITDKQLFNTRNTLGYTIVKNIDNITNRQFLAAKALPPPTNGVTITGAGCGVHTLQTTFNKLLNHATVANNINRLTIKPNTIFKSVNGVFELVPDSVVQDLSNPLITTAEALANAVNNESYFYTPFYYVLDSSSEEFDIRPYRLDNPSVVSKYFDKQNTSLLIDVFSQDYVFVLNPNNTGYLLAITLKTSDEFKALDLNQVFLQLSFIPPNTTNRVYINGVLVSPIDPGTGKPLDNKYVYHFALNTNFDVDSNNRIVLTPSLAAVDLTTVFDLSFIVKDHVPINSTVSDIDNIYDETKFIGYSPSAIYRGLVNEKFTLKFGDYLKYLWNRARTLAGPYEYEKYTVDIPWLYESDIFEKDSNGNIVLTYNAGSGEYVANKLHSYGDPILDGSGNQVYKHRVGDVKLDSLGNPIIVNGGRDVLRQMDLLFIDGKYYFANNDTTTSYRTEFTNTLTNWITSDIEYLNGIVIDSEVLYYPKTTVGELEVFVTDVQTARISADQKFKLTYHVSENVFNSTELRDTIRKTTSTIIAKCLEEVTVVRSNIIDKLKEALGDDVLSISLISDVFADDKYSAFTLKDLSVLPTIGKQLVALSNQTLAVQDSISIEFIKL